LKDPKPKALDKILNKGFGKGDQILYEANISPEFREFLVGKIPEMRNFFSKLRDDVRELVRIRNSLFENLNNL